MHHTSSTITLYQLQNIFPTLILPKLENSQLSFLDSLDVQNHLFRQLRVIYQSQKPKISALPCLLCKKLWISKNINIRGRF